MKRPGGFDRGAERENERERESGAEPRERRSPRRDPWRFSAERSGSTWTRAAGTPAVDAPAADAPTGGPAAVEARTAETSAAAHEADAPVIGTGADHRAQRAAASAETVELAGAGSAEADGPIEPSGAEAPRQRPIRAAKRELGRARRSVRARERRESRRFTAHIRRRRRAWLIAGGAVLALAAFVAVGVLSPLTAVREVEVQGADRVDAAELQLALARFDGTPLALVQEADVHRALEPFPLIQRYSLERIPPHTLVVRIEERDPVIAVKHAGRFDLRDPAGVLLGTAKSAPKGVPVATGRAADPATPAFEAAARVIRDMPRDLRKRLLGVKAGGAQDVTFSLRDGKTVIWGEAGETQKKAVVLRAILKSVKTASVIDVSAPDAPVFE